MTCHVLSASDGTDSIRRPMTPAWSAILAGSLAIGVWLEARAEPGPTKMNRGVIPIRGLHLGVPAKKDLGPALEFIREVLPKEGVNTLMLEFDYNYDFRSRTEFADPSAPDKEDVQQIVKACRAAGIELIPQINCLGHQSWAKHNGRLLDKHPEFDETPGKFPGNEGIYCRSYCPLHPEVHRVLFDLIDELAGACEAKSFHVGMDEVFILADPDCPRCHGKTAAVLFAGEVNTLHAHLKETGRRMWMWGDRFLDGKSTGLGKWEASENGTHSAVDLVPRDIVICDWHYDQAAETPRFFANKAFEVVVCPWRKTEVALAELAHIRTIRAQVDPNVARRALGVVQTTWCGLAPFVKAYKGQASEAASEKNSASDSARCFVSLFKALREEQEVR